MAKDEDPDAADAPEVPGPPGPPQPEVPPEDPPGRAAEVGPREDGDPDDAVVDEVPRDAEAEAVASRGPLGMGPSHPAQRTANWATGLSLAAIICLFIFPFPPVIAGLGVGGIVLAVKALRALKGTQLHGSRKRARLGLILGIISIVLLVTILGTIQYCLANPDGERCAALLEQRMPSGDAGGNGTEGIGGDGGPGPGTPSGTQTQGPPPATNGTVPRGLGRG